MATTADFRNGMVIVLDGRLYTIIEFQHVKPGKGGAFVRTKLKGVVSGKVIDKTFRAGERVEEARVERNFMQYLYAAGGMYYVMDPSTYEQIPIPKEIMGDAITYLKENTNIAVLMYEGSPIAVELPFFVDLKVAATDPGMRGDTATGGTKPATLETGAVVQVPLFVSVGDTIRVDTRKKEYIERVT
ncbi:MAG: elongation factor P [bacterium]